MVVDETKSEVSDATVATPLLRAAPVMAVKIADQRSDLVGVTGFEPVAPRSQSECATKLRHTPAPSASVDGCAPGYRYAGRCCTRV